MTRKIQGSWEKPRKNGDLFHSPQGIQEFRETLRFALTRKYVGMAESMWEYEFPDEQFDDFRLMSQNVEPERTLMRNGFGTWFEIPRTGQWHFLPAVYSGSPSIYGFQTEWSPVPVGYQDSVDRGRNPVIDEIRDLRLNHETAVLMKDNLYSVSDYDIIVQSVNALVDNDMTLQNLIFLMKSPYVFRCNSDNILDAKNYMLALAQDALAWFRYSDTEAPTPVIESTGVSIDSGLLDTYRHWESQLLANLGIPGAQAVSKRTVQTEDEINLPDDMITLRRQEKFRFRKIAIDRLNELAGTHATVRSVIDDMTDNEEREGEDDNE